MCLRNKTWSTFDNVNYFTIISNGLKIRAIALSAQIF